MMTHRTTDVDLKIYGPDREIAIITEHQCRMPLSASGIRRLVHVGVSTVTVLNSAPVTESVCPLK